MDRPKHRLLPLRYLTLAGDLPAAGALDPATHVSLPIPCPGVGLLLVAFLYCGVKLGPSGPYYEPPSYVGRFNMENGALFELLSLHPNPYPIAPESVIWTTPEGAHNLIAARRRFVELWDQLLPRYATGAARLAPPEQRLAAELFDLFGALSEPPLCPYYRLLGQHFFSWLRSAAQSECKGEPL